MRFLLLASVFVIATCGLIYELIAGALASYLLGDSITQFSTIIGVYLFSMGVGSYLSKYIDKRLIQTFIQIELIIGLIGGCSAAILFVGFELIQGFRWLLYGLVSITGILVGLEIPLLMRILKDQYEFKDLVSKIFSLDYVGALLASLIFPLFLIPYIGLVHSGFIFGLLNACVGVAATIVFRKQVAQHRLMASQAFIVILVLGCGLYSANSLVSWAENMTYDQKIIYAESTPYQRIILTRQSNDLSLFLNGNLQFNTKDEYRYHEALVHPGLSMLEKPKNILVLGGGDGLAVREILRYPSIERVVLVDLDPAMTKLFKSHPLLSDLNNRSFSDPRVTIVNQDAFSWLRGQNQKFDFIVIDFPDPSNFSLGKLYTQSFYRLAQSALEEQGVMVVQSTSPAVAPKSFWCINNTLASVGLTTLPYNTYVPSFGLWGFVLATKPNFLSTKINLPPNLKYLNMTELQSLYVFAQDVGYRDTTINKLNNQILVHYFEEEWSRYGT